MVVLGTFAGVMRFVFPWSNSGMGPYVFMPQRTSAEVALQLG